MRLANRLLATVVAAGLLAAGLLTAVEVVVGYYAGRGPWLVPYDRWYTESRTSTWSDRTVVFGFVLVGVAGVVVLGLQLLRRKPPTFTFQPLSADVHSEVRRRSLQHALTRAAQSVDGVAAARVRVGRRRVTLRASTERRLVGDLPARVRNQAESVLEGLGLAQRPSVRVSVTSRRPPRQP